MDYRGVWTTEAFNPIPAHTLLYFLGYRAPPLRFFSGWACKGVCSKYLPVLLADTSLKMGAAGNSPMACGISCFLLVHRWKREPLCCRFWRHIYLDIDQAWVRGWHIADSRHDSSNFAPGQANRRKISNYSTEIYHTTAVNSSSIFTP